VRERLDRTVGAVRKYLTIVPPVDLDQGTRRPVCDHDVVQSGNLPKSLHVRRTWTPLKLGPEAGMRPGPKLFEVDWRDLFQFETNRPR
jgi:hypothetical protein